MKILTLTLFAARPHDAPSRQNDDSVQGPSPTRSPSRAGGGPGPPASAGGPPGRPGRQAWVTSLQAGPAGSLRPGGVFWIAAAAALTVPIPNPNDHRDHDGLDTPGRAVTEQPGTRRGGAASAGRG